MASSFKDLIRVLGSWGTRSMPGYLKPLKDEMMKSNLNMLFEVYVGKMMLFSVLGFFMAFSFALTMGVVLGAGVVSSVLLAFVVATVMSIAILVLYHSYPIHMLSSKKNSIETNMPFALNHMGAIAASGVPPFIIFKLLASIPEYGEVSNECKRIVRNVEAFGMDLVSSTKNVAERTPSAEFRQFLYGVVANTETGGNLRAYLENSSKEALFDYKLRREKYMQTLSTYADFYTAVLIAAPLFFVSVLSVLSLIGGEIFGLDIPTAIRMGVYILMPMLNIVFIMFIHYTQPKS